MLNIEATPDTTSPSLGESPNSLTAQNDTPIWVPYCVLSLLCLISAAIHYARDNIIPLQNALVDEMKLTDFQYSSISTFYSLPNIVLPVFSGLAVDKLGYRLSTMILLFICLLGQTLICFGTYFNRFCILLIGRLIFGVGSESLQLATSKYIFYWFSGFLVNLVFGIIISVGRALAFVNMFCSDIMYNALQQKYTSYQNLTLISIILLTAAIFCFVAVLGSGLLFIIDKKYQLSDIYDELSSTLQLETVENNPKTETIRNKFMNLSAIFWLLCWFCFFYYLAFSLYFSILPLYLQLKYKYPTQKANETLSLGIFFSMALSIIFGLVLGKIGLEAYWFVLAPLVCLLAHTCFSLTFVHPALIVLSRHFGLVIFNSSFWPCFKYIVPFDTLGFATGIILAIQNLGLGVFPIFVAYVLDNFGYFYLELCLQYCFSISLVIAGFILLVDQFKNHGVLSMTTSGKIKHLLGQEA